MTATDLWYFRPDPDITEILEWSTEVLRCRSGTQRIAHRQYPRITLRHKYVMTRADARRAELLARTKPTVLVPLWQDSAAMFSPLGFHDPDIGETIIWQEANIGKRFRVGDQVALIGNSTHELLTVDGISWITSFAAVIVTTGITLKHTNALLMPVVEASVTLRLTRVSGDYVQVRAEFVSTYPTEVVGVFTGAEIALYRDAWLMTFRPLADIDSDAGVEWLEIDGGFGNVGRVRAYAIGYSTETVRWYLDRWDTVGRGRRWCYELLGSLRQFWLPTFNHDFQPIATGALSGTTLTIADCGYAAAFDPDAPGGSHLAIYGDDGLWYPREITGVAAGTPGISEVVTVDSALPAVIPELICQLRAMRIAGDKVEWRYGSPGAGANKYDPLISTAMLSMSVVEEVPNPYVPIVEA